MPLGAIYKPNDENRRKKIDEALRDLDPGVREPVRKIIESYHGNDLEKKLTELVGYEKMKKIVEKK
jgi:hypothetical protein